MEHGLAASGSPGSKQDYQFTMSGPTGLPRTTFLANASYHVTEGAYWAERRFTPLPADDGLPESKVAAPDGDGEHVPLKGADEWAGILKLSNRSLEGREIAYQILFNSIEGQDRPRSLHLVPDAGKIQRTLSVVHGLSFTHTLTPKRYYQVDLRQNYYDYRDMAFENVWDPRYDQYGPVWHTPHAWTRTITSSGPATGAGTSFNTKGACGRSNKAAFTLPPKAKLAGICGWGRRIPQTRAGTLRLESSDI